MNIPDVRYVVKAFISQQLPGYRGDLRHQVVECQLNGRADPKPRTVSDIALHPGTIVQDQTSGWTCVPWPASVTALQTGKPVKVHARAGTVDFDVTLMPTAGLHMVPLRKDLLKKLGLALGDPVTIEILGLQTP